MLSIIEKFDLRIIRFSCGGDMDIAAAISGVTSGIEILKALRSVEKAYDQASLKIQIAELMEHLFDAKLALIEARDQIALRDREINELKLSARKQDELVLYCGQYYEANEEGKPKGYPLCGACIAEDGTQVRYNNVIEDMWLCPKCNAAAEGLKVFS